MEKAGYGDRFCAREMTADTVEHAAAAIGCLPAQIANAKYKATFGAKAAMIPFDRAGGACPSRFPGGRVRFAGGIKKEAREHLALLFL